MEILLIACMLAYAAGAQSEQSKLGISPAQRAILKEQSRHEKAVQKIADKHGMKPVGQKAGLSPWKEAPGSESGTVPDTFMAGYRMQRPSRPPLGHRVGARTGSAITWAQDSGRDAWRAYRESRRKTDDNPQPVLVPVPPAHPPNAPPMPQKPPTVHERPEPTAGSGPPEAEEPAADKTPEPATAPEPATEEPAKVPDLKKPDGDAVAERPPGSAVQEDIPPESAPVPTREGVGRMAAEVTYESVMDESDELSAMCEDDSLVYNRIHDRAEREIGRGDELIAALENAGFGSKVIGWVARCKENYGVILSEVGALQQNTIAQGEAVVKAKAFLEAGQGVYADIAKDMEDVAERESYVSDAVDAGDVFAHREVAEGGGL